MSTARASLLMALVGSTLADHSLAERQTTPICGITGTESQLPSAVSVLRANRSPTGCINFCKKSRSCRSFAVSSTFCWLCNHAGGTNFRYNAASNYKVWDAGLHDIDIHIRHPISYNSYHQLDRWRYYALC